MFTGLIECTGVILEKEKIENGLNFTVKTDIEMQDLKKGDSVSINGACQTVTSLSLKSKTFSFYSSYKTIQITTLGLLEKKSVVNLERALLPSSRIGGHIVQGHVDTVGTILYSKIQENGNIKILNVGYPEEFSKYIVERGSIAVDGISLTVVQKEKNFFEILLIPETIQKTNARFWEEGGKVNLEMDILARYMENFYLNQSRWKNFLPKFFG